MARAPLDPEERLAYAQFVYVGRVEAIREDGGALQADLAVERIEKKLIGRDRDAVTVHYVGDAQHRLPREGEVIRVFVRYADGQAHLIEPNGWEPAG